ncbi:hypothetical protein EDD86DRAFT_225948 [Gorgonomyces haynaldii]|nr:hypothetical protein EDD86DRAFT_225948 [Gorgonomyces haynaldii]
MESHSRFKNIYSNPSTKSAYSGVKIDTLCNTKLKCNDTSIAIPGVNGASVGVFPLITEPETTFKVIQNAPLLLNHGKQIQDFEFAPTGNLLCSVTRQDCLVRLWQIPEIALSQQTTETDLVHIYLAGHEKRIDAVKFHPTCQGILSTASSDQTIRLWDTEQLQDKIVLESVQSNCTGLDFDYFGNLLSASYQDSTVHVYDPRQHQSIQALKTEHHPTKGCKAIWLHPDPFLVTTGFNQQNQREIKLWDQRKHTESVQSLFIAESGVSMLQPFWDPCLPLLYMHCRGEALRVYEFQGTLSFMSQLKMPKLPMAVDLLPKTVCQVNKCEIARFIRLGTDMSIEHTSIYVPRVNGDSVFQEDLYPPLSRPNQASTPDDWFEKQESIAPLMTHLPQSSFKQATLRSGTVKKETHLRTQLSVQSGRSSAVSRDFEPLESGYLELETKGWFYNGFTTVYVTLKANAVFYGPSKEHELKPILYERIKSVSSQNSLLQIESMDGFIVFKAESEEMAEKWMKSIQPNLKPISEQEQPKLKTERYLQQMQPQVQPNKKQVGAIIMGEFLVQIDKFVKRTVILDSEAMLKMYQGDFRAYLEGQQPISHLDLSNLLAVYVDENPTILRLVQSQRHIIFKMNKPSECQDWLLALCNLYREHFGSTLSDVIASTVKTKPDIGNYLFLMNGTLFLFKNNLACEPTRIWELTEFETTPDGFKIQEQQFIFTDRKEAWNEKLEETRNVYYDFFTRHGIKEEDLTNLSQNVDASLIMDESKQEKGNLQVLLCVFNKTQLCVSVVPLVQHALQVDCSYILDKGSKLLCWSGPNASRVARAQALDVAQQIRKKRSNRPQLVFVEDDTSQMDLFFSLLNVKDRNRTLASVEPDLQCTIYRIIDSTMFKKKVQLVYQGTQPRKSHLSGVCVVQQRHELYLWLPNLSTPLKRLGYSVCHLLMEKMKQSHQFTTFELEIEHFESVLFLNKFVDHVGTLPISMRIDEVGGNIANIEQEPIDIPKLLLDPPLIERRSFGETVSVEIWKVEQFQRERLPLARHGIFMSRDSYIILYIYKPSNGQKKCISYFWQGSYSTINEKGTSAFMTVELSQQTGLEVEQMRVEQGREPLEFMNLFEQVLILNDLTSEWIVMDIRSQSGHVPKAVQIEPREICFCSDNTVLMIGPDAAFVYCSGLKEQEALLEHCVDRFASKKPLTRLKDPFVEPLIGFLNKNCVDPPRKTQDPRVFQVSGATGSVQVSLLHPFVQEDFDNQRVMILDAVTHIFVWFGTESKPNEKKIGLQVVRDYLKQSKRHNPKRLIVCVTFAYQEPQELRQYIHGWTTLKYPTECRGLVPKVRPFEQVLEEYEQQCYPLDILLNEPPEHLDRKRLEYYLSDTEFETLFNMNKASYESLQQWKRQELKRKLGFY